MSTFFRKLGLMLPWRRRAAERDMSEELRSIRAMAEPRELGNLTLAAEDARAQWGWVRLEQTAQDIRYAIRTLRKAPAFTLTAVLSLSIGIGANTALFTLIDTVMWKLLPISQPEQLLTLAKETPTDVSNDFTYQQYETFRQTAMGVDLAAYGQARVDVSLDGRDTRATDTYLVTGRYFPILGLRPAAGRLLDQSDDRAVMGHPVAVMSYRYWQRQFALDQGVIGRTLTIAGLPFTVVGVAPPEFFGTEVGVSPDLYLPVMMQPALIPEHGTLLENPNVTSTWLRLIGRLKAGFTLGGVEAPLNALRGTASDWRMHDKFTGKVEDARLKWESAATGISDLRRQFSQPLFVLLGVSGLVLLIACANVGQLLLARSATRRSEFALRLALGASRARVVRQVIVEGLVLASGGAVAGVALAYWVAPAFVSFASAGQSPVALDLSPDLRMLGFTAMVSILAGLIFASAPAVRAARADRAAHGRLELAHGSRVEGDRRSGKALVVAQVALSLVLLVAAGHFVRTLQNLYQHKGALELDKVVVVSVAPRGSGKRTNANAPTFNRIYRDLLTQVDALPGVQSASLGRSSPLGPNTLAFLLAPPSGGDVLRVNSTIVYPRYFTTVGMPLVDGRDFGEDDLAPGAPRRVVVNTAFVRDFLKGKDGLGTGHGIMTGILKAMRPAQGPGADGRGEPLNIIGIVDDSSIPGLRDATQARVYQTYLQASTGFGGMVLHVRATRSAADLVRPIGDLVRAIDRETPLANVHVLRDEVNTALARERLLATLAGVFGLVALLLISVGLYGLMAFTVSRRTSEIGIRVALGATRGNVRWLVGRQALTIVLIGLGIGLPAAWIAGRLASRQLSSLLYQISSTDPTATLLAAAVLVVVATVAGMLPARRAVRIDPVVALRTE